MKKLVLHGEFDMNCYILEYQNQCFLIDPGYEKDRIIAYIKQHQLKVIGILLTHGHYDHIGALDCFLVPIYVHRKELDLLKDNQKNGFENHGGKKPYCLEELQIQPIDEQTRIPFLDKVIEVLYTPGHTYGGVCYKIEDELYSGDTLFKETVGDCGYPTGNLETMKKTIVQLIDSLPEGTKVYPGHDDSSTIGWEKRHNPYYKEWKEDL